MSDDPTRKDALVRGLSRAVRLERSGVIKHRRADSGSAVEEPDSEQFEIPDRLGIYRVLDFLARGGVGLVYRVADAEFDRELAIKVLSRRFADDPQMVEHFRNEGDICSQLQHPGIVPIHHRGELEDGRPFFTMKIVEGDTLSKLLRSRSELDKGRHKLIEIFERVCQTIAYAHAQGVVHGDLKPSNVMIGAFGEVQVMDWGFARVVAQATDPAATPPQQEQPTTASRRILGTPAYMAPEQARGDGTAISPRTDVFGLGAILCEILTGEPPNRGETRSEVFVQAAKGWHQETGALLDSCDADPTLVQIARSCLATEPGGRPEDAGALHFDARRYLESVEERSREMELKAVLAETRAAQERKHRKLVISLSSTIVVAVLAMAGSLLWIQSRDAAHREETHRLVAEAMVRALAAKEDAEAAPPGEVEPWQRALIAAENAQRIAAGSEASGEDIAAADDLRAELATAAAAAASTRDLIAWLRQNQPHYTDERELAEIDEQYGARFARFGLDIEGQGEPEIVARIRATRVPVLICEALADWASASWIREQAGVEQVGDWRKLVRIAQAADPDPFRTRVRDAMLRESQAMLRDLAHSDALTQTSPVGSGLLAKCLFAAGETELAISTLREASLRHPGDYRLQHDLAVFLRAQTPMPIQEITWLTRAALALRPDDPHALADHSHALFAVGEAEGAEQALRRALEVAPEYARLWSLLSTMILQQGRILEADQACEQALEFVENDRYRALYLGLRMPLLWYQGRFGEARGCIQQAMEIAAEHPLANGSSNWIDIQSDDVERALERIEAHRGTTPFENLIAMHAWIESGRFDFANDYFDAFHGSDSHLHVLFHDLDSRREADVCRHLVEGLARISPDRLPVSVEDVELRAWSAAAASLRGVDRRAITGFASSFADDSELLTDPWLARWGASTAARLALDPSQDDESRQEWSKLACTWLAKHLRSIHSTAGNAAAEELFSSLLWIRRIQASRHFAPFWAGADSVPNGTQPRWNELEAQLERRARAMLR